MKKILFILYIMLAGISQAQIKKIEIEKTTQDKAIQTNSPKKKVTKKQLAINKKETLSHIKENLFFMQDAQKSKKIYVSSQEKCYFPKGEYYISPDNKRLYVKD